MELICPNSCDALGWGQSADRVRDAVLPLFWI
jgi:hypothetical protein